jgi:hypothetical protein
MAENFITGNSKFIFMDKRAFSFLRLSILSLFLLAGLNTNVFGQTWIGTSGGDWLNGANWVGGVPPTTGGNVVISFDQSSGIFNIPTISLNSLTINGNAIFESLSDTESITITGNFSVASGKTFQLGNPGSRFLLFRISSSATGTISGTTFIETNITIRLFQVDGDLTIPAGGLITSNGSAGQFTVSAAGTLRIGSTSGITTSGATGSIQVTSTRTYSTGANYHYIGNANQAVGNGLPATVASLTISNTGGSGNETVSLGSSIVITNALTVNSGVFALGANNITSVGSVNLNGTSITGSGTISLNGNISTNISSTTAIITAPINLGAVNRTFTIPDGAAAPDLSISSVISGGGGIIKAGTGSYIPSGSNTYTGLTTISAGRIRLGATGGATNTPLGTTASGTIVSSGAELDLNGFNLGTAEPLSLNGTGISSGGALNNTSGTAATYSGLLTLTGASTIVANAGAIAITNGGTITGAFNLTLDGTTAGSVGSIIGIGAGSVIKNGTGLWTLSGANTFSGGTTLNSGTLNINNSSALGSVASTFTINGGTIDNTSAGSITTLSYPQAWNADFTFTGTRDLNLGNGTVTFSANRQVTTISGILTVGGTLSAASSNLTKAGGGSLIFGVNPVTLNGLSINSGTLTAPSTTLNLSGNFANSGTFNNNGGTVNFNGGSSQSIAGVNYNIVTASGAGTKSATGNVNIANTFTNASIFDMGTNSLSVVGAITNTGTIRFGGATNGFAIATGTVEYNGSSQTVGIGTYQSLTINQSSGDAVLTGATTVNGVLGLNGGNLNVATSILTLGSSATTAGAPARFIIATGGGEVRKIYSSVGAFSFPIGENTGVTEYSPITVNVTAGAGLPSYVGVSVVDSKHPNNASTTNFLSRYWNLNTAITGCVANVAATYPNASISGTEASISAGQLNGTFNQATNPWIKFTALSGNILNANVATINTGQTSVFTGIIGSNPSANAGTDIIICNLVSATLGGTPTASNGAGGYIYSWTPTTGLSASNVGNPTFTAIGAGTTTYTVTVTDANGFVASDPVDVTVNPIPTPVITGTNNVCQNQVGVSYSTPSNLGRTYVWTVVGGTVATGAGTASITVNWGAGASGTIQLVETITATTCPETTPIYNVTINTNPTPLISGLPTVCANQIGVVYSTPSLSGRSYAWNVSNGTITAGAGTNSITVSWGATGPGNVQLTESITATGCFAVATAFPVSFDLLPIPTISGANSVCENQSGVVYTTPGSGNTYIWTIGGGTITAGAGTNSITVAWNGAGAGTLQLTETIPVTLCSVATPTFNVAINANPTPVISGTSTVCANQTGLTYTTAPTAGRSYAWSVTGGTITAGAASNTITVSWGGSGAGSVQLTETISATGCSAIATAFPVTINALPTPTISGANSVCANQAGVVYTTSGSGNSYVWTIGGGTITTGAGTNSVTVTWNGAGAGTLQLTETITATTCLSTTPVYNITINANPTPLISGTSTVCANQTGVTYATAPAAGRSYAWSVTGGTIISGAASNTITVSWSGAGAGSVQLTETISATGCSVIATAFPVTINALPTPTISGANSVCANQAGVVYTTSGSGNSYVWTIGGGTITAGAGTNSVTVTWNGAGAGTLQLTETITSSTCSVSTPIFNVNINARPVPVIGGSITVCANQAGVAYSTPSVVGDIYIWSISSGSITSGAGTNAITITWGTVGAGTITLTEISGSNGCVATTAPYSVTINAAPTPSIVGTNSVCQNDLGKIYSTSAIVGDTYSWTVTGGTINGSSTNNTVVIDWGAAGSGSLQLTETNSSGCPFTTPIYNVAINTVPTPVVSGAAFVCANQNAVSYSTTSVVGNTYTWLVTGGSIISGVGTNSISVNWNGAGAGSVLLTETKTSSGCSTVALPLAVTINPNPTPSIFGANVVCANESNKLYSTTLIAGNTYSWAITGGVIIGASNGNSIVVNWGGAGTGTLILTETITLTSCVQIAPTFTVNINATPTPAITGASAVCANQMGVAYSTPNVIGDFYNWSVIGGTIASGAGTNSIVVNWGGAGTGTVSLTEFITVSGCAVSAMPTSVTINPTPTPSISGSNTVCANDINKIYASPLIGGHTYSWTVTGGVISGSSINNSVSVDWGAAGSGTLQLTETITSTGCAISTPIYNIIINNIPTPVITGLSTVCAFQNGVTYSTTNVIGNSYTWVVSGGSIVSGAGTNSISVNWNGSGGGSVTLTEFIPSSSCLTTTAPYSIIINPIPTPVISGINTVCANDLGKIYSTLLVVGNSYSWVVTGGTISGSSTNNSVVVNWGATGLGTLQLTEIAGCFTTTPIYSVTINPNASPLITGLTSVCANQSGVIYSSPNVVGHSYFWSVSGGSITAGVGTNSITVSWGAAGSGNVVLTEAILSSGCSITTSPTLVSISSGTLVNAGTDAETCAGTAINLSSRGGGIASGASYASLAWSGGAGTFSNASILNPTYTPGVGETGLVTLTLTATGIGICPSASDQMVLAVTPLPIVNAGSDAEVCQGITFGFFNQVTNATASNFSSILWTKTGGTGTIFNASTLSPTYQPSVGEFGTITFTLTANSIGSCVAVTDNMQLTITKPPIVNAGSDQEICMNTTFNFSSQSTLAIASNYSTVAWTTTGIGSFTNTNTFTPTYVPGVSESGTITFTLTANGNGSCVAMQDQMVLTVTPKVIVNAGSNAETCKGISINFGTRSTLATASNFNSLAWSGGVGTITNGNTLTPTYTPGIGETGVVTFTLTATGNGSCTFQTSTMQLTITPLPTANAGSDAEVCRDATFNFSSQSILATATNYSSLNWTTTGTGTLTNATTLTPNYTPNALESGAITFTLIVAGNGSCTTVQDQMVLVISPSLTANAGSNEEICQGGIFNFVSQSVPAAATNFSSLSWSHSGSGTLFNANTLTPLYQSGASESGTVLFTLTANGIGSCSSIVDFIQLTIRPSVIITAGSNAETCAGIAINFASRLISASGSNYSSLLWTHTGSGGITNATTLSPTYTPGVGETGNVIFTLTANGVGVCPSKQSQMTLTITPAVIVDAGSNLQICQAGTLNFNTQTTLASASFYSSVAWTHTGAGLLFNSNTLTPTYFAGASETGNILFTLRAFSIGSCVSSTDVTTVNIVPAPISNAGSDAEVCEGSPTFDFNSRSTAANSSNGTVLWTHNGAGNLSSTTAINPVYTLAAGDFGNVITFTLKVTSGVAVCSPTLDQFTLKVNRKPIVTVPTPFVVCETSTIALTGTIGGTATTGLWSVVTGDITGLSATNVSGLTVKANYDVNPTDVGTTVVFRLTSNDPDGPTSPCTTAFADLSITINRAASITAGIDLAQCKNQASIVLQGAVTYAPNGVQWGGGAGGYSLNTNPTSDYSFANPSEISSTSPVILTLTALDPDGVGGPCTAVTDQMKLTINPLPVVAFFGLPSSMAENNPPVTLSGNLSGGSFTISPITSSIPTTNPNPLDNVLFDPSAGTIGLNTITYTFTDSKGCTNSDSKLVIINPVTTINWTIDASKGARQNPSLEWELCGNQGDVQFFGSPPATGPLGTGVFTADLGFFHGNVLTINKIGSDYFIDTNTAISDKYFITYTFTNTLGATTSLSYFLNIFAKPNATIVAASNCISSAIPLNGSATFPPNPIGSPTITNWNWNFGDGVFATGQNVSHAYPVSNVYSVTLTAITSQGCSGLASQSVRVGDVPIVDFDWSAICTNDLTKYKDLTNPGSISTITNYAWDFGDGDVLLPGIGSIPPGTHGGRTVGTYKDPQHNYVLNGGYSTKLTVGTNDLCSNSISRSVFILPAGATVQPNSISPYFKDFEANDGGWIPEALKKSNGSYSQFSWTYGTPLGNNIKTASSGTNAWWTGNNFLPPNNGSTYFGDEKSAVNGPCFDLTQLHRPMVSFDYWSDSENFNDGSVLQYSTDGGLNWKLIGSLALLAQDRDQGINWYDPFTSIFSLPGQQSYGWSGKSTKWKNARFNLDMVDTLSRGQVRVRVAFASNTGNGGNETYDGFAFDNFFIGEKKRNVLIEHFTNSSLTGSLAADSYLNGLYDKEINLRGKGDNDFNDIQYHISYSSANSDLLNADNPNDPNARASSYGVSQPPKTFMDGIKNAKFDGNTTKLNNVEIDRRALKDPKFTLKLDTIATNKNNFINVQLTMTADTIVNVPLIAQVALVEEDVVTTAGTFKNVLRKLLFGSDVRKPDGITITQAFTKGQSTVRPQPATEIEINAPIKDPRKLKLIGFIQDKNTGEIYQSTVMKVKFKTNSPITGLGDDPTVISNLKDLQMYPNPANGKFNFALPGNFPSGYIWKIADQRGIFIMKGDFNDAVNGIKTVDVSSITNGLYFVLIGAEGKVPVYKKLVVMNQD